MKLLAVLIYWHEWRAAVWAARCSAAKNCSDGHAARLMYEWHAEMAVDFRHDHHQLHLLSIVQAAENRR